MSMYVYICIKKEYLYIHIYRLRKEHIEIYKHIQTYTQIENIYKIQKIHKNVGNIQTHRKYRKDRQI